jgi:hypothetical protein
MDGQDVAQRTRWWHIHLKAINIPLSSCQAAQHPIQNGASAQTNLLAVTVIFAEILITWLFV